MKVLLIPVAISLALFSCLNNGVSTQILLPGACPNNTVVQNFSVGSYLGAWYEIERTFTWFSINATCVTANYSDWGNGSVRVENTQINGLGNPESIVGSATPEDASKNEAKLVVTFPFTGNAEAPYWVLDTDYTDYSIVWSCRTVQESSWQTLWFLSRTRNSSESTREYVRNYLNGIHFDLSKLSVTDQTNCSE